MASGMCASTISIRRALHPAPRSRFCAAWNSSASSGMGRSSIRASARRPIMRRSTNCAGAASIYPCACTRKEIAERGRPGVEGPVYAGTCRSGMAAGREARALRLLTTGARVQFHDSVLGPQTRDIEHEAGDFVLYRADGVFAFHLASAVDDGELRHDGHRARRRSARIECATDPRAGLSSDFRFPAICASACGGQRSG